MHRQSWQAVEDLLDEFEIGPLVAVIPNNRDPSLFYGHLPGRIATSLSKSASDRSKSFFRYFPFSLRRVIGLRSLLCRREQKQHHYRNHTGGTNCLVTMGPLVF